MFALVDGNSFYASVEQVFAPDAARRPVVVLPPLRYGRPSLHNYGTKWWYKTWGQAACA